MDRKMLDLTGHTYGKLTVLHEAPRNKGNERCWLCLCECGNHKVVTGHAMRRKNVDRTMSCGCSNPYYRSQKQKIFPDLEYGNAYVVLTEYVIGANIRGLDWKLNDLQAMALFGGNCYYCGQAPSAIRSNKRGPSFTRNGIDRLDPAQGYIFENCVSCCSRCNYFKHGMDLAEFLAAIEAIYLHSIKKLGQRVR